MFKQHTRKRLGQSLSHKASRVNIQAMYPKSTNA